MTSFKENAYKKVEERTLEKVGKQLKDIYIEVNEKKA